MSKILCLNAGFVLKSTVLYFIGISRTRFKLRFKRELIFFTNPNAELPSETYLHISTIWLSTIIL
ncbi:hypothetical protein FHG68_02140 [Leptospira weilii]|nr:hypothetical protein FHG67_02285 [Leptospira weilii]QDK25648.1 hypothetical protein FHG68_02140 [Leptospira weilii]